MDELPARLNCIIAPSWTFVWYLCVRFQMRWHRPLILTSDVFNSSVGDPAIGFVGSGGAPCALYMRGEMSLEDVQSGKEGYGMQGRHTNCGGASPNAGDQVTLTLVAALLSHRE